MGQLVAIRKSAVGEALHPFDAHVRAGGRPTQEMIDFFRNRKAANIAAGTAKGPQMKKKRKAPPKARQLKSPLMSRRQVARVGAVGAGVAGLGVAAHKDSNPHRKTAEHGAAAVGAADIADIATGVGIKRAIARHRDTKWTPKHQSVMQNHLKRYGHVNSTGSRSFPSVDKSPEKVHNFYTHYPKSLPGGTAQRMLAHQSHPRVYGGTLAAAGATAAAVTALHEHNKPKSTAPKVGRKLAVEKADLEWHTRRTSALHGLGAAGGAAIFATGASRSGMVGRSLAQGTNAARAMQTARRATRPIAVAAHTTRGVGGLVNLVPTAFRPALAMGLGASILYREVPRIRQDHYTRAT